MTFDQLVSMAQAKRGIDLAHWLVRRLWPKQRAPHGFYQPASFLDHLYENRHRPSFVRSLETNILFLIREKDARRSREELAKRYRLQRFINLK